MSVEIGLDAWLDLGNKVDSMCREQRKVTSLLQPLRYPFMNAVNTAVTGTTPPILVAIPSAVGLGSPAIGRVWQIIKIGLFGGDDHTAVSGVTASIFVGPVAGQEGGGAVADLVSCIASNVTIPYLNLMGKDRVWMENNMAIYAFLYGTIPANQQFTLIGYADDYPLLAKEALHT